ncbi:hypothetical protein ABFS82_12G029800 [Erythranthe guttata]
MKHTLSAHLFFHAIFLLSIYFLPGFFCQTIQSKCGEDPFNCGSITYITYPFWGGNRPAACGRPGFELICRGGDVPMLKISPSLSYRVEEIDFTANTLRVAREDLWNTTCPEILQNTTIDIVGRRFEYSPESKDENVTLYFDCDHDAVSGYWNSFVCRDGRVGVFVVAAQPPSSAAEPPPACKKNIYVPVSQAAARSLRNLTIASSVSVLQKALTSGFSIRWSVDVNQFKYPYCNGDVYRNCGRPCTLLNHCNRGGGGDEDVFQVGKGPPSSIAPTPQRYSANDDTWRKRITKIVVLVVVALCITTVITVSVVICSCVRRRRLSTGPNQKSNQDVESILVQHGSLSRKRYKYSEIKKITKSFNEKLGQGGYGSVYKGVLPDGSLVAVKVLIETNSNGEEFINEVASISRTSHVNIVNLLGFCFDRNKRALVYQFMPNKSLDKFIGDKDCPLDIDTLYDIAVGVAKGLEYLHMGCNTRIVHFDIKPQNILLDEEFCPKISDFGLAKLCKKKQSILSVLGTRGTIGYIAPEIFSRNFGGVSHKSDVYSYGMMVLEMAGARKFVGNEAIQSSENYFPDEIYEHVVDATEKANDLIVIDDDEETTRKMFLVGFWCIQTTPSDRPSMSKVVEMLEGSIESIQVPPKPVLCTPTLGKKEISSFSVYVETENSDED